MKTKFIGLEGFNEIESLSKEKKRSSKKSAELSTTQKTVRFVKRASALCAKNAKKKSAVLADMTSTRLNNAKAKKAAKPKTVILDKQYTNSRQGGAEINIKDSFASLKLTFKKRPAHSAPSNVYRAHALIKKRAVLAIVACSTAVLLSCVTVASAVDGAKAPVSDSITAEALNHTGSDNTDLTATVDEVTSSELANPDLFVTAGYSALYIDGELIGVTAESDELNAALDALLLDSRKDYDEETTTEFANDVYVEKLSYTNNETKTAQELMDAADGKFSVLLSTDWSYDIEIDYDTDITYDEEQDSDYEKVVTEGEKGVCEVNVKLTYIDGVFADSVVTDTKVTKEPVTEEIIRGSKQGEPEETKTAESGSSTGAFIWPLPHTHNLTSYFEWRWGRMHQGIDIAGGGDYGQPIIAADGGVVTFAGNDGGGYGNYVMIDHGNGYMTVYGHASELACSTGDYVSQGETIAYVGSTGNSTGPHLHFEIRENGVQLNPLDFVS